MNDATTSAGVSPNPPILNNMGGLNPQGNQFFQSQSIANKSVTEEKTAKFSKTQENWCGLDWLTLTLWINFGANWSTEATSEKNWREGERVEGTKDLRDILDAYQLQAMAKGEAVEVPELGNAMLHPGGGKIAKKYCRFKLELESAVILIADQPGYNGDWPNVKIEISGEKCLCYTGGAPEAYRDVMQWLDRVVGGEIHKERVSRVDLCADFPGMSMDQFIKSAEKRHWTCRSRLYHPYLKQGATSLYWGAGATILRVYDKLGEMKESALRGAPAKYEHMIQKRWGGVEPENAIRVEYQLRRDSLKGFGITDFDSLAESHGDLIKYLTGKGATLIRWNDAAKRKDVQKNARWFRFLMAKPDSKHPERNETLPHWELVQDVFCSRFLMPEPLEEIQPENSNIETLLKQAFGVLETAASNSGYEVPGKKSFAPEKFRFANYAAFEKWMVGQLRTIAIQKAGWEVEIPDNKPDSIDEEILDQWEPSKNYLNAARIERNADEANKLEAIGLL